MEPILIDLPTELTTERLLLRVPQPGDGVRINAAVVESAAELALWMPWAKPTPKVEDTEKWVRQSIVKFLAREQIGFSIYLKGTDTFIGSCGSNYINWKVPFCEIGYWLRTTCWGKGYMTEAVSAVTRFAFDVIKVHRVQLRCDVRNERSAAVAKRAGFSLEGVMRNDSRGPDDQLRDTCMYARTSL